MNQFFIPPAFTTPIPTSIPEQQIVPIPHHPKIKPLFRIHNQKTDLEQPELRKLMTSYRKASDAQFLQLSFPHKPRWSLQKYQKVLKHQKKLLDLSCSFDMEKQSKSSHIFAVISHISSLSTLALESAGIGGHEAIVSSKSLASLKNLSSLGLYFGFIQFPDADIFKHVCKSLQKIPILTALALGFFYCFGFNSQRCISLSTGLGKLVKLRTLELIFSDLAKLDDSSLNVLASSFSNLPLLTKADITLKLQGIQSSTLVNLFVQFRKLKFLSDIRLDVQGASFIQTDNSNRDPIAEGLDCLDFALIRRLSLGLSQDDPTLSNLSQISQVLRKFSNLATFDLHLDAKRNPIALELLSFSSSLSFLVSLTSLKLRFPCGLWSLDFMKNIAVTLESLPNLVSLLLDFGSSMVLEDDQLRKLFGNLRFLKALKYLDLRFGHQENITNKTFKVLSKSIEELVELRYLFLDFASAGLFTNNGVKVLALAIQNLKNLFDLTLNFGKNFNIDDEAMNALVKALKHLSYLFSLKMSISKSPNIIDFQGLIDALLGIKNLEKIDLSLPHADIRVYDPQLLMETRRIKAMII